MSVRLPAKLEVSALVRQAESAGGFGAVLHKGEAESGTILVVLVENQQDARLFERMPRLDGTRGWTCSKVQTIDNKQEFEDYLQRRKRQDPDVWIVELIVADGERLILNAG